MESIALKTPFCGLKKVHDCDWLFTTGFLRVRVHFHKWTANGFIMASDRGIEGRNPMGNHAVTLRVTPLLRIECKFWLTDDGWNGSCEQPSITVQAGSFEHAKSEMEIALGKYIESLLPGAQRPSTEQAA